MLFLDYQRLTLNNSLKKMNIWIRLSPSKWLGGNRNGGVYKYDLVLEKGNLPLFNNRGSRNVLSPFLYNFKTAVFDTTYCNSKLTRFG